MKQFGISDTSTKQQTLFLRTDGPEQNQNLWGIIIQPCLYQEEVSEWVWREIPALQVVTNPAVRRCCQQDQFKHHTDTRKRIYKHVLHVICPYQEGVV